MKHPWNYDRPALHKATPPRNFKNSVTEYSNSKRTGQREPGWKGPRDAMVMCGNCAVCSTVMPWGTVSNCGFPLSQQHDRQQTEHKGSSRQRAIEPSATGLQQSESIDGGSIGIAQKHFRRLLSRLRSWAWSAVLSGIECSKCSNYYYYCYYTHHNRCKNKKCKVWK